MSFSDEKKMYPILEEYFDSKGYRTLSQASFRMIKLWLIDVVAYEDGKKELIAVEAKLNLEDALDAISQAEMYQMACSKVYVAFPHTEWDSRHNRGKRRDVEEICKKRGIGILKVIGRGLTRPCEEVVKPALSLNIDLLEKIIHDIKKNFDSFAGFDQDDFSYFLDHLDWKKEIVRKKIEKLEMEIQRLIPIKASFLGKHKTRVQAIGKDYAGINIFKGSKHTLTKHYSIGMGSSFLSVFIQIPSNSLVKRFLKKLSSNKREFLSLIGKLPGYDFELYNRTSKIGRPLPGATVYKRLLTMKTDVISSVILEDLISLIKNTPYPAVNFGKDCSIDLLGFEIKRDEAIDFIFETISDLGHIYSFIP